MSLNEITTPDNSDKSEESAPKKVKLSSDQSNANEEEVKEIRICKHVLEKKKRRCKFNALRNLDYCVAHLAFNDQTDNADKRVICPLDPKHSVYEKNLKKHLKKCNAKAKCLGDYDIKDINVLDDKNEVEAEFKSAEAESNEDISNLKFTTYKELDDAQFKHMIGLITSFDEQFKLYDLEFNKLEDEFLANVLVGKNDKNNKHLEQISSIVSHVEVLLNKQESTDEESGSTCLVELGAGRGKLSYWYEQSRNDKYLKNPDCNKKKLNILLIERGSQRFKFDYFLKQESSNFERIKMDLKDFYLNKVDLIENSKNYLLYGKHLCGVATDYALRALKRSIEDSAKNNEEIKFSGLVLAVCCHNQCVWESFCGKKFFEELNIDSKMFYIIRSMTSWYVTCSEANKQTEEEIFNGTSKQKLGRICKNLFDYARLKYLNETIKLPDNYKLNARLFYYVETDVTLENTMIYVSLEKK